MHSSPTLTWAVVRSRAAVLVLSVVVSIMGALCLFYVLFCLALCLFNLNSYFDGEEGDTHTHTQKQTDRDRERGNMLYFFGLPGVSVIVIVL